MFPKYLELESKGDTMTENKKSFIKSTILGLLGGGALSSLYAANAIKNSKKLDDSEDNSITVPLSRKHYMKAVGLGKKEDKKESRISDEDIAMMAPQDLAALKKTMLRKNAGSNAPVEIKDHTGPVSSVSGFRKSSGKVAAQIRDEKGRFSTEVKLDKKAGSLDEAKGLIGEAAGFTGGVLAGSAVIKMLTDRILINKKKRQVEESRRAYVDMLNREISDVDEPYYTKRAGDSSLTGKVLGIAGITGISTAGIAGMVMYKIMENRRKQLEDSADSDIAKYPADKTIKFKFAEAGKKDGGFFG